MLRSSLILSLTCFTLGAGQLIAEKVPLPPSTSMAPVTQPTCACSANSISKAFTNVAQKAIPAVVFLKVEMNDMAQDLYSEPPNAGRGNPNPPPYGSPYAPFGDEFFQRFFGFPSQSQPPKPLPQLSQGSGFFVSPDGYIMTNSHVVTGANKISVVFSDGRELDASIIGTDPRTDIAIIKVEGTNYPYLGLGDSEAIEIAEWVMAIGSPFQLQASVTVGVVSAKGRQNLRINDFEDFIQTDAAINPGNSGGPLLNLNGEVIGINTAIFSRNGGYMGIGFAIPSNMASNIMKQIIETGTVIRGFLGVSLQPIDKELADAFHLDKPEGALVAEVIKNSPAEQAGLKQGDIIIEYNKIPVKTIGTFKNAVSMMKPGTKVNFKVNRKGQILTISIEIGNASDNKFMAGGIISKIGIEAENLTPEMAQQLGYPASEEGVVITKVKPGSPAAMTGIRPGYIILAVNHKKVLNLNDFTQALNEAVEQKRILMLIRHGNGTRFYTFKIE